VDYGSVIVGQAGGRGITCSPGEYFGKHRSVGRFWPDPYEHFNEHVSVRQIWPDFYQHFGERL